MLLRLSVANCLSIADRQELSLVATTLKGPEDGLIAIPGSTLNALPSAVIYGANASGKTNFLRAFTFLRHVVLQSHSRGDPEGGVPRVPFALAPDAADKPTEIEVDFLVEGVRYQYGFECDDNQFISEWLYSYPEGKPRKLFDRKKDKIDFGPSLKGPKQIIAGLMRPNSLFLSTATQNSHEELSKLVSFFRQSHYNSSISVASKLINNTFKRNQIDDRTVEFLKHIGTGITGYRQIDVDVPESYKAINREFNELLKKHFGEANAAEEVIPERDKDVAIEFSHKGVDETAYYFGLERESSGTRRLILIMNMVFQALDRGSLVIIDELDASLHTHAAEQVIKLFADKAINKKGAQLIAATHDTNLLGCSCLRRDQIWFCEKDEFGSSHLFPLSDIKSRQTDNFEQGYLEGRYGAIPFSGDVSSIFKG